MAYQWAWKKNSWQNKLAMQTLAKKSDNNVFCVCDENKTGMVIRVHGFIRPGHM